MIIVLTNFVRRFSEEDDIDYDDDNINNNNSNNCANKFYLNKTALNVGRFVIAETLQNAALSTEKFFNRKATNIRSNFEPDSCQRVLQGLPFHLPFSQNIVSNLF